MASGLGTPTFKEVPLTKIVAELFQWIGSPMELDALVGEGRCGWVYYLENGLPFDWDITRQWGALKS